MNIRQDLQSNAHGATRRAIERGELVRPTECELCGKSTEVTDEGFLSPQTFLIAAHHWAGYDQENWLNVWWICQGCNVRLGDRHDGSLSKEQAVEFLRDWDYSKRWSNNERSP